MAFWKKKFLPELVRHGDVRWWGLQPGGRGEAGCPGMQVGGWRGACHHGRVKHNRWRRGGLIEERSDKWTHASNSSPRTPFDPLLLVYIRPIPYVIIDLWRLDSKPSWFYATHPWQCRRAIISLVYQKYYHTRMYMSAWGHAKIYNFSYLQPHLSFHPNFLWIHASQMNPNQFHMMQSGIKTVGIGITMRKTVAVGSKFCRIYKVNKIKYGEKYNKLNHAAKKSCKNWEDKVQNLQEY